MLNGTLQPLGVVTVTTSGTSVSLVGNAPADGSPTPIVRAVSQLILQTPASGNTGAVYICLPGGDKTKLTSIILEIPPATTMSIPHGALLPDMTFLDISQLVVDADTNGNKVRVTAILRA